METIFKNGLIFLSGFAIALIMYSQPLDFKSKTDLTYEDDNLLTDLNSKSSGSKNSNHRLNLMSQNKTNKFGLSDLKTKNSNRQQPSNMDYSFASSQDTPQRPNLNDVPNIDETVANQIPTEPPTGRPETEDSESEDETENADKKDLASSDTNSKYEDINIASRNAESANETSLSSVSPSGVIIAFPVNPPLPSVDPTSSRVFSGGRGSSRDSKKDISESDVLPDEFTTEGLAIAKRLFREGSLSEEEYLDYLSLGLSSSDTGLSNAALNELASVKSKSAFLLLTQYSNSSNSENLNLAIENNYTSARDLRFLSQMIGDSSSVDGQNFAVESLNIILSGDSMNFENQQVRDTLINTVHPSLNRLSNTHPSFDLAQSISKDINKIFA